MKYTIIIGLEVHIELSTNTKMFCGCSADPFAKEPNTQVCPVCLGLPGALPYANAAAIERVVALGHAFGCDITKFSKFDRKHYFYPDLPKSFQTSQYDLPFCVNGEFEGIKIRRVHLEEDTAKLAHSTIEGKEVSLVDFNRSGVPLVEMVTEPDFHEVDRVLEFLKEVQKVIRYLGISTAEMEKGSMRLEANISLSTSHDLPDYKVELKNINSFKFLKKALEAEIERQAKSLDAGEKLVQETRGYNEATATTFSQRVKEEAADYRYFPEPDLPPIVLSEEKIAQIKETVPELPIARRERFVGVYAISPDYAEILTVNRARGDYFEQSVFLGKEHNLTPKQIANAMINTHLDEKFTEPGGLIKQLVVASKKEFAGEDAVSSAVSQVITQNGEVVEKYKAGKVEVIGFLIGAVQKELKGAGDVQQVKQLLEKALN